MMGRRGGKKNILLIKVLILVTRLINLYPILGSAALEFPNAGSEIVLLHPTLGVVSFLSFLVPFLLLMNLVWSRVGRGV